MNDCEIFLESSEGVQSSSEWNPDVGSRLGANTPCLGGRAWICPRDEAITRTEVDFNSVIRSMSLSEMPAALRPAWLRWVPKTDAYLRKKLISRPGPY